MNKEEPCLPRTLDAEQRDRAALHEAHQNLKPVRGESEYVSRSALFPDRRLSMPMQRVARRVWARIIAERNDDSLPSDETPVI
jgi:hypothetical protein